jgi:hypothetical protein
MVRFLDGQKGEDWLCPHELVGVGSSRSTETSDKHMDPENENSDKINSDDDEYDCSFFPAAT